MNRHVHTAISPVKRAAIALLAPAMIFAAAACGSDSDDTSESTAASTSPSTAASSASAATDPPTDSSTGPSAPATTVAEEELAAQPLPERATIKVTIPAKYETFSSVYVGLAMGEFDKENLDVEIVEAPSTDAIPMLQRGDVQVQGCGPSIGFINAVNSGIDMVWAAPNSTPGPTDEPGLWVSKDLLTADGALDPAKLVEATIGLGNLQLGSSNALPMSQYLSSIGVALTDLKLSPLNGGDLLAAFENGAVQGAWLNSPLWQPIKESGNAVRVVEQGDVPLGGYCLGPKRSEIQPQLEAFFRALARTNKEYLQGDYHQDDAVVNAISEAIGIDAGVITSTPALQFDPELKVDASVATDLQTIWIAAGLLEISEPLPASRLVDQSIVTSALE